MRKTILSAAATVLTSTWATPAVAQQPQSVEDKFARLIETQLLPLANDLDQILFEGPKYLAKRLPSMQAAGDLGAEMDLAEFGDFSISVGLMSGVYQGFNEEITGKFQKLPKTMPEPLPLPAALFSARLAVNADLEAAARLAFFPEIKHSTKDWDVAAATRMMAVGARYRLLAGRGAVPTLVSSAELSYFTGYMELGLGRTYNLISLKQAAAELGEPWEPVREIINDAYRDKTGGEDLLGPNDDPMIGTFFHGAPIMGWDIFQLSVEQRAVWALGFFHPYLGLGLDAASGHVDSGVQLEVDLRITRPKHFIDVAGDLREVVIPDQDVTIETRAPRTVGARGIVGWEFHFGESMRMPLEAQYDFTSGSYLGALGVRYAYR